jgi:tetratricopeptide (TPR) repeat protein
MRHQTQYRAFISYSHADARQARAIHRFIEAYSIPNHLVGRETSRGKIPKRLRPVFKDREELPTASDLGEVVNDALKASEHLIVICSPTSATSRWVNQEVLAYKRMGRADRILCIIVSGEPNATDLRGREADECFCEALRFQLGTDGQLTSERAEPVAADARLGSDGRYLARLKLVAGMLGVGLDELRQRDMQRRNRRMAAITTASVAGMALTLMLAWAASVARDDAERRRAQADDLIGFMLGDLRERLNEVGRLDVLDSVAAKALDYFAELPPKDLNEDALANRAEALLQLGQVQLTRRHLDDAMAPFAESLQAIEELTLRDPANLDRLYNLGQAHFWVGYVHWESDDLDAADESMQRYYRISETLYNAEPENDDYILELGYSFNNLAILSNRRGDIKAALNYNQRMIDLSRAVYERDKENEIYRRALADAYSWSGSMLRNDNQFAASAARFAEYLKFAEDASRMDPADTQWIDHRMRAHQFAGISVLDLGDTAAARGHYEAGIVLARRLIKIEPANENWQVEYAMLGQRLAQMDIYDGMIVDGLQALRTVREKVRERLADNPESTDWLRIGTALDLIAGKALLERGNLVEGASIAKTVVDVARQLVEADPTSVPIRALLANSLIFAARISAQDAESLRANSTLREALAVFSETDVRLSHPEARDALIRAALYAGRTDDIAEEIEIFRDAGYRHPDFVAVLREHGIKY